MKARFRVGRTAGRKPTLASLATPMFWLSPNNVQIILRIFAQLPRSSRINAKAFSRDLIGNRSWEFGKIPDRTRKAPFRDDDVLDSRGLFSALEALLPLAKAIAATSSSRCSAALLCLLPWAHP